MVNQKIALVVDDEKEIVESVSDLLKKDLHYLVLSATEPEGAVDMAQNYLFDLLIIDLHMPRLDGFQVMELVRKKQPSVKVMVITGLLDAYKDRLKHVRVDKIIEKPFDPDGFIKDVLRVAGAVDWPDRAKASTNIPCAKILIVDDEQEQCECLRDFFQYDQPSEYTVEFTTKAEDGVRLVNEFEPDFLIFDIKMPYLKGDEMYQVIKKGNGHKPRVSIVVSAVTAPAIVEKMTLEGCVYIRKPFRIEPLLQLIRDKCLEFGLAKPV